MLQQTRVAAVLPYYERFLARFPHAAALAGASESELLGVWSGLGYYSRVRNMQRAARVMNGSFPREWEQIRALPGVGDYTAAAVASIAFGTPQAAVDGNALRVLSRLTDEPGDLRLASVRTRLTQVASELLDSTRPGDFNQAVMELGATLCLPRNPQCLLCPVSAFCEARCSGTQNERPVTGPKRKPVRVKRTLLIIVRDDTLLMWQRPPDAPKLAGFWELPEPEHMKTPVSGVSIGTFRHSITNHIYSFEVRNVSDVSARCKNVVKCRFVACNELQNIAISTTARKALRLLRCLQREL